MSLKRAVIFSTIERYYGFCLALVATVVISRLLGPSEVGAFAVAMSVAGIAGGLREFGASSFLIRSAEITEENKASAFGLSLLLGTALGIAILLAANPLAAFFDQPGLVELLAILSLNLFLLPFGTVNNALIQRAMRFDLLARINIIAATLGFLLTVLLAWLGLGARSLAWGAVALSTTAALLSVVWGPGKLWLVPRLRGCGEIVGFGAQVTGLSVLSDLNSRYPEFVLAKIQDVAQVGLYSRAMGLIGTLNDALLKGLSNVALSHFAQIRREDGDPVSAHLHLSTLVTGVVWPLFIGVAFFSESIVYVLYGPTWMEAAQPLQVLCLYICIGVPFSFQFQVVLAKGGLNEQTRANLVFVLLIRAPLVTLGASWGGTGVAIGIVAAQVIGMVVNAAILWPAIGVGWRSYWSVARANAPMAAAAILVCTLSRAASTHWQLGHYQNVFVVGSVACAAVVACFFLTRHPVVQVVTNLLRHEK